MNTPRNFSHYAEANRLIDELHDWQSREGETDTAMLTVALEAQAQAALALAEQQRIANLIALTHVDSTKAVEQADYALYTRTSTPGGIELPLRPEIVHALRIETT